MVGVRHILEDSGPIGKQSTNVIGMIVEVKPQHGSEVDTKTAAVDLALEEIVSVPVAPLPITAELLVPFEPEE